MEGDLSNEFLEDRKKKKLICKLLIGFIIIVVILAIILGLIFGLKKDDDGNCNETDDDVEIVNSYENTEELMKKFPLENAITVQDGMEKNIQNRLLTGFENWNRGYKAWKKWGNILYTNDSIYNVNGVRLTLTQYQKAMDVSLKEANMQLGAFHNMIINGEYTGIFYDDCKIKDGIAHNGTVMEFVWFKDYGKELRTRVAVGWGGTKGSSFNSMRYFQGDEERMVQDEKIQLLLHYQIPDIKNLTEKYPILYPTEYLDKDKDKAKKFIEIILEGFDNWNTDVDTYIEWLSKGYTDDALSYGIEGEKRTMKEYKDAMQKLASEQDIKKLYFYNILIRDDWAAIHYQYRTEYLATNKTDTGDRMQFLNFKEIEGNYKIKASWTK